MSAEPAPAPLDARALLDAAGDLVLQRAGDGRIAYVNAAFLRMMGGAEGDWVGRWFAFDSDAPEPAGGGRRRWDSSLDTVVGPALIEWEETRLADGGAVLVGRDVSRRRAGEAVLRGAREAAEAAAAAKEALFAVVTHEFRTPVNGVMGLSGLLRATALTPEQADYVDGLEQSGRHLLTLVDDILDAARLEAGAAALDLAETDPVEVLQRAAELLAPRAREAGLDLVTMVDPAAPRRLLADAARLRQIVLNLAGNAVKFTVSGGVALSLEAPPAGGRGVVFAVRDTGPGVSAADKTRIFEAFQRGAGDAADRAGGAGLGLAIAQRLAAAMDGTLTVDDAPGGGAVFRAHIPADPIDPRGDPMVAADALAGVRAVVVGAAPLVAETLARQLAVLGADADVFGDAAAARRALDEDANRIVFADVAVVADLRAVLAAARGGIALAAPDERSGLPAARAAGAAAWLVKPWRLDALITQTRRAWGGDAEADAPDDAVGAPPRPAPRDESAVKAASAAGARVLLVEDNPVNALISRTQLARLGCAVEVAASGPEAVDRAAGERFDLILMDMRLPGFDGPQAARTIRAGTGPNADAPILALTANAAPADRAACAAAGMQDFLVKPVEPDALAAALARWRDRRAGPEAAAS